MDDKNVMNDVECRRAMLELLETFPDSERYTERFLKDLEAAKKRAGRMELLQEHLVPVTLALMVVALYFFNFYLWLLLLS